MTAEREEISPSKDGSFKYLPNAQQASLKLHIYKQQKQIQCVVFICCIYMCVWVHMCVYNQIKNCHQI